MIYELPILVVGCLSGITLGFVALANLCDEWLVPHLMAVQKLTSMSDDVAGATILALGSAAPEFAISTISVFHGDPDVGFGLIIGSALIAFGAIPPLCYFAIEKVYSSIV